MSDRPNAVLSPCRRYRYSLTRQLSNQADAPHVTWVMLNPSTADASVDDPTIRRCMAFSRLWGFGRMVVVNLFAWRATNPLQLKRVPEPIGAENDQYLFEAALDAGLVLCAWGKHGEHMQRATSVRRLLKGIPLHYLRLNRDGSPQHPLYVPANVSPQPWRTA